MAVTREKKYREHFSGLSTDVKPVASASVNVPLGSEFWESDKNDFYRYGVSGWEPATKKIVQANSPSSVLTGVSSIVGTPSIFTDTTKNYGTGIFVGKGIKLTIVGVDYYRTITANAGSSITITSILEPVSAGCVHGGGTDPQLTIVVALAGMTGNNYDLTIAPAPGSDDNLSASLNGELLTVYLGKTAGTLDDAKNTGLLIATAIDQLPEFSCTMTGVDGVIAVTAAPVPFIGGANGINIPAGTPYEIITPAVVGVVQLVGTVLLEQQDDGDDVAGTLTFTENISTIEIFNTDAVNPGVFTANGIALTVPASGYLKATIGGTPGKTVVITGATTYLVKSYQ